MLCVYVHTVNVCVCLCSVVCVSVFLLFSACVIHKSTLS
jgi:hypothetical protein